MNLMHHTILYNYYACKVNFTCTCLELPWEMSIGSRNMDCKVFECKLLLLLLNKLKVLEKRGAFHFASLTGQG